jgi:dihydrofolate reductase
MKFSLVAAADEKMGIGINNSLPWRLKGDLKFFSDITTTSVPGKINAVIMGRKTWESLPEKSKPLKDRVNVVLSRGEMELPTGVILATSLEDTFEKLAARGDIGGVFVIGGASIYAQAINHIDCDAIFLTEVSGDFKCDAFFPYIPDSIFHKESVSKEQEENGIKYRFAVYRRIS